MWEHLVEVTMWCSSGRKSTTQLPAIQISRLFHHRLPTEIRYRTRIQRSVEIIKSMQTTNTHSLIAMMISYFE